MRHTRLTPILPLLLAAVVGLAACGDDTIEPAAGDSDPTVPPVTTTATTVGDSQSDYEHPMGADDVILQIEHVGGFLPVDAVFSRIPALVVTGDGRRFTEGPQIAIYPGPLLPNVQVADIGEQGIQDLLAVADEAGLLQHRTYDNPTDIADAPDTVVTVRVGGQTYVHRAYALGFVAGFDRNGSGETGARGDLADFVAGATSSVFESESFSADDHLVRSFVIDDLSRFEIEPTVIVWPNDVDVDLAAADDCVSISADLVGDLFADANELTFFEQGGVTYRLAVKPVLPGVSC